MPARREPTAEKQPEPGERAGCIGSIMVVDDDPALREALREILRQEGYEVRALPNGQAALDHLRSGARPDLILLDLMMPVLDGWQFRSKQVLDPRLAEIPVVVMSAASLEIAPSGVELLPKPMSAEDLLEVASRYIRRATVGEPAL